jgi:LCP family protein required for cell wall assembly
MNRTLRWTGRTVVVTMSAALFGAIAFGYYTYHRAVDNLVTDDVIVAGDQAVPMPPGSPTLAPRPAEDTTILLVGVDSRTDAHGHPLSREVLDELRAGNADGEQNTDTMMVVHIPADPTKHAFAVSLPRDSYVDIAGGFGTHKLNSAYARAKNAKLTELLNDGVGQADAQKQATTAGRRNLIATVTALTGLRVDHYAEINLYGFSEITKAVGGVPVCLNEAVHDKYSGAYFPAGKQTLKGVDALKFVRQRHGLPGGDLDRVRRQQAFLAGLANRIFSAGTLTDLGKVTSLVDSLTNAVVLDKNWDLVSFAQQLQSLTGDRVRFFTIPTIRPDLPTPYDGSAVEVDPAQVRAFVQNLLDDPRPAHKADPPKKGKSPVVVQRINQTADEHPIDASEVPCVN